MSSFDSDFSKISSLDSPFFKMSSLNSSFSKTSSLTTSDSEFSLPELNEGADKSESQEFDMLKWYKEQITTIIYEYLSSNDIYELIYNVEKLGSPEYNPIFIKKLITISMDQKNREKEMSSFLISSLSMEIFTTYDVLTGFAMLLRSIDDTMLDIPDVSNKLALFLARAIIDDVLAPVHLDVLAAKFPSSDISTSTASQTIATARKHALSPHAGERLERCWGWSPDSALRETEENVINLLEEYRFGGDLYKALNCIRDIGMSFLNHEIVKRALFMAMEKNSTERMLDLLQECYVKFVISESQMILGFQNVKEEIEDLVFDIPKAKEMFDRFVERAKKNGWLESFGALN